jgi:hypothetical protein
MKSRLFVIFGVVLLMAGCRTNNTIRQLERELFRQENEIYRLRGIIEDMQDCSDYDGQWRPVSESSSGRRRSSAAAENANPLGVELPGKSQSEVPPLLRGSAGVPEVPENIREPSRHPTSNGPRLDVEPGRPAAPRRDPPAADPTAFMQKVVPAGDSRQVAAIALDPASCLGIAAEDGSGNRGLLAVIQPLDAAGRPIAAAADVSVAVLDPAIVEEDGRAYRVARWDFTAAEISELFRGSGTNWAIHLKMAWPADPPEHNRLHLFVRYQTADGRLLEADCPIEVALPGDRPPPRFEPSDARPVDEAAPRSARHDRRETRGKSARPAWSPQRP